LQLNRIHIIISLILFPLISAGQDIHFSQFDATPMMVNPSSTGNYDGKWRFILNQRDQWRAVAIPYKTLAASCDTRFILSDKSNLGLGLQINTDKSGDAAMSTNVATLHSAIHQQFAGNRLQVSAGASIGFGIIDLDYNKLNFDSQFNGDYFDPDLSHGVFLMHETPTYIDISGGASVRYSFNPDFDMNIGGALYHINQPERSFFSSTNVFLNRKMVVYVMNTVRLTQNVTLLPQCLLMQQESYRQINFGSQVQFATNQKNLSALFAGVYYRWRDAVVARVGFQYAGLRLGLSYDINASDLVKASYGRGGLEISLIYITLPAKQIITPKNICPVFM